jgi:Na+-translocating ferredoxin:NAD+ oxidoreductase subunit G
MNDPSRPKSHIGQAWLVILLGLLYGGALAGVQTTLGPIIEENRRDFLYRLIPQVVPGADTGKTIEETVTGASGKQRRVYRALGADGRQLGWVVRDSGPGFADNIDILVGLDLDAAVITGMRVLDQRETPAVGNKIEEPAFRDQFAGKPADRPLAAIKSDPVAVNEVCAVTGATISSESVAAIVNAALDEHREAIRRLPPALDRDSTPRGRGG